MSGYVSESSCDSVKVSSQPHSKIVEYDYCPKDTEFRLRLRILGKIMKLSFTLKEGIELPYTPTLKNLGCPCTDLV